MMGPIIQLGRLTWLCVPNRMAGDEMHKVMRRRL
jgi:hypothetical protein